MRTIVLLAPILLVGGYALLRLSADPGAARADEPVVDVASADLMGGPVAKTLSHHAVAPTVSATTLDLRVPQLTQVQAELSDLGVSISAGAHADVRASLEALLAVVGEHVESVEEGVVAEEAVLAMTGDFLAELAASLEAHLEVETPEGPLVLVTRSGGRR